MAADSADRMIIRFRSMLKSLDNEHSSTMMHEDNMACLVLSKGEAKLIMSKHISLRYHYLREKVASNEISLSYISTEEQLADLLTKPLALMRLNFLSKQIVRDYGMARFV